MRISNLVTDMKDCYVVVSHVCSTTCKACGHENNRVTLTYAPSAIATDTLRKASKVDILQGMAKLDTLISVLKSLLHKWDVELDPPEIEQEESEEDYSARLAQWEESGPHIVPLTDKDMGVVPVVFLAMAMKAIVSDVQTSPTNGSAPVTTLPAQLKKKGK